MISEAKIAKVKHMIFLASLTYFCGILFENKWSNIFLKRKENIKLSVPHSAIYMKFMSSILPPF